MVIRLLVVVVIALALSVPVADGADVGDVAAAIDLGLEEVDRDASDAPLAAVIVMPGRPPALRRLPPRPHRAPGASFVADVFRPPRPGFEPVLS